MNSVQIQGRIAAKPEVKTSQKTGNQYTRFTVVTDTYRKDGEKKTQFHSCIAGGKIGETIAKYYDKGGIITVEGSIDYSGWQGENGESRIYTTIMVARFDFCGQNAAYKGGAKPAAGEQPADSGDGAPAGGGDNFGDMDDIPF